MKVTHTFTMATPVNCYLIYEDFFCSHDICRIKHEEEQDYNNTIKHGLDKDQQREYAIKFRGEGDKLIQAILEIFDEREARLIPTEWQEVYLKYLKEKEDLKKQKI
jgi:hypothetical protein